MSGLDRLREAVPEWAMDLRLNLPAVLEQGSLEPPQRWGIAVACAIASGSLRLRDLLIEAAGAELDEARADDARAAAALMGMNNVYYRFRHFVGKESYGARPPRLRMNRLARPRTSRAELELYCLAVSAVNGCEACVRAHENVALEGGVSEEQVHDAIRIAAVVHGAAVAIEAG